MLSTDEKKSYFDQYWRQQPVETADPRAVQRAEAVFGLMRKREGRLLEVGCGRGVVLDFFARRGFDVTGSDISPEAVALVDRKGYSSFVHDLEADDILDRYEIILCLEVLQQVHNPVAVLEKLKGALSDNGEMIVSLPNEFHLVSRLRVLTGSSHLGHFEHSHIRLFTPNRDRRLFAQAGLEIEEMVYLSIVPPRMKTPERLCRPLCAWWPALFALSSVYRVREK